MTVRGRVLVALAGVIAFGSLPARSAARRPSRARTGYGCADRGGAERSRPPGCGPCGRDSIVLADRSDGRPGRHRGRHRRRSRKGRRRAHDLGLIGTSNRPFTCTKSRPTASARSTNGASLAGDRGVPSVAAFVSGVAGGSPVPTEQLRQPAASTSGRPIRRVASLPFLASLAVGVASCSIYNRILGRLRLSAGGLRGCVSRGRHPPGRGYRCLDRLRG